jgi:class 3 adenylate cyclase
VLFDKRGTGVSDPLPYLIQEQSGFAPTIEDAVRDLLTVLDDLNEERCVIVGNFASTPACIAFAALHPRRAAAVILIDPFPRVLVADDYPFGFREESVQFVIETFRSSWGQGGSLLSVPSLSHSSADVALLARMERLGCGRGVMTAYWEHIDFDVRPMLPLIQAPTLIIAHGESSLYSQEIAYATASMIEHAEPVVIVPGEDLELYGPQPPELLNTIDAFLHKHASSYLDLDEGRRFAAVMFTDVVDSTGWLQHVGDARWLEILDVHEEGVNRCVRHYGGRVVKQLGDGTLAVFDSPGNALRCAQELRTATSVTGIQIRVGMHAGEITGRANDITGLAVHIAARVVSLGEPNEVLATRTVKDLVAGAGFSFKDRGEHHLKGVDDAWQLYSVGQPSSQLSSANQ